MLDTCSPVSVAQSTGDQEVAGFDTRRVQQHSFVESQEGQFIQERQLSVSDERMCTNTR